MKQVNLGFYRMVLFLLLGLFKGGKTKRINMWLA